jgi:hypothetical protein
MSDVRHVWLWAAGERYSGVSDDEGSAKEAAMSCLLRGDAARVERALFLLGAGPVARYEPLGVGWQAVRPWDGPMVWKPLHAGTRGRDAYPGGYFFPAGHGLRATPP